MTKRALGVLRDTNAATGPRGGAILFVSSIGGFIGTAGGAFYHASKFAMEGFAESVAKELDPRWNIHLSILEPGGTATEYLGRSFRMMQARHPAYAAPDMPTNAMLRVIRDTPEVREGFSSADDIARAMWELLTRDGGEGKKKIPVRVPLGSDAWDVVMSEAESVRNEIAELEGFSRSFGGSLGVDLRSL